MSDLYLEPERLASPGSLVSGILAGDPDALSLFPAGVGVSDRTPGPVAWSRTSGLGVEAFRCTQTDASERLEAVLSGKGLVVTTGQQPQLFGGPLYIMYKALTAVRTAAALERRLGIPCIAVFWVAADDHDWQEIASVGYLDRGEVLRQLDLTPPVDLVGQSVGPAPLPAEISELTRVFLDSLESHAAGERWLDLLRDHYVPGRSFTDAFIGVASAWLDGLPIAFLDSAHPAVRRASIPFVGSVIDKRALVDEALGEGAAAVRERGHDPQLTHLPGALPLFRDGDGGRYRLRGTSGPVLVERGGEALDIAAVAAEATAEASRYSPSAALRPVLESWLLPVGATVLGPGEIGYWAQLGPLFQALEVAMPPIVPRDSWRVVEPRVARLLRKTGVSADELRDGGIDAAAGLVKRKRPAAVEGSLRRLMDRVEEEYDGLDVTVTSDLPGLRPAVGKSRSQALSAVSTLKKTLDSLIRDREASAIGQLRRAATNLYPRGTAQERALAAWVYLARHGDGLVDAVREAAFEPAEPEAASAGDAVAGTTPAE